MGLNECWENARHGGCVSNLPTGKSTSASAAVLGVSRLKHASGQSQSASSARDYGAEWFCARAKIFLTDDRAQHLMALPDGYPDSHWNQ